jgi:threonine/homoserine/homoserine lactone efflux protein
MVLLLGFVLAFFFSFLGSIPPGILNLAVIELGLEHKIKIAWRFAIAAAIIEYPYAWLAIKFERLITSSPVVVQNMQLLTAVVMIVLGIANIWAAKRPHKFYLKFKSSGFRRGIILSILNPLAFLYWTGITAYLKNQQWITLSNALEIHVYLAGVALGALALLILLAYLAGKLVSDYLGHIWIKKIPGYVLLLLGLYALIRW